MIPEQKDEAKEAERRVSIEAREKRKMRREKVTISAHESNPRRASRQSVSIWRELIARTPFRRAAWFGVERMRPATTRALRWAFRTVEHFHHSESMMSRSGASIPTVPYRGGWWWQRCPPPIGPTYSTYQHESPGREHDPTRVRKSLRASPCVCFT